MGAVKSAKIWKIFIILFATSTHVGEKLNTYQNCEIHRASVRSVGPRVKMDILWKCIQFENIFSTPKHFVEKTKCIIIIFMKPFTCTFKFWNSRALGVGFGPLGGCNIAI